MNHSEPLRILHVYDQISPESGGPSQVIAALAGETMRQGLGVSLLSHDPENDQKLNDLLMLRCPEMPKRYISNLTTPHVLSEARNLLSAVQSADVLHLHGVWTRLGFAAGRLARKLHKPYILTPHGCLDPQAMRQKSLRKKIGNVFFFGPLLRGAARIHALTQDEAEAARSFGFSGPIDTIPNGVYLSDFITDSKEKSEAAARFRASIPHLGDAPFVLFLSRLHQTKGLDLLGEAFARLAQVRPDVHLVAIGADWGGKALLEQTLEAHHLSHRLHCPGPRFGRDKLDAFAAASIFCLPSRHEGQSIALLEALASGLPVVITPACHVSDLEGAGIIASPDAFSVAEALFKILEEPDFQRYFEKSRAFAAKFSWQESTRQLIESYRATL